MKLIISTFICLFIIVSCDHVADNNGEPDIHQQESSDEMVMEETMEEFILNEAIAAHGKLGHYQFEFRGITYTFNFEEDQYAYTRSEKKDSIEIFETLTNEGYSREINGVKVNFPQSEMDRYSESLNSVIYFVCLPHNLTDLAVNKEFITEIVIKDFTYYCLEVTFDADGGGKDYDDVFYYWINKTTNQVDYFAYQYSTNGGGVRFREAFNSHMIDGMRFQDYINYSAPVGTSLNNLPKMFENNELEEVSRVLTENVKSL